MTRKILFWTWIDMNGVTFEHFFSFFNENFKREFLFLSFNHISLLRLFIIKITN